MPLTAGVHHSLHLLRARPAKQRAPSSGGGGEGALGSSLAERTGHEQASELPKGQKEGHLDCELG